MAEFDVIIRGGTVVDGTRLPRYRADVGIKDGKIAKLGKLKAHEAKQIIDAGGMNVVPGFVDLHTHTTMLSFSGIPIAPSRAGMASLPW